MHRVVLLIGHGPTLRTVVRLHLADRDHEYVEAPDAGAACALLARGGVDVVIGDASGEGDARALLAAVRAVGARPVPLILVAPQPGPTLSDAALGSPPCAVVPKPLTAPRLRAALREILHEP